MTVFYSLVKNDTGFVIKQFASRYRWFWAYFLALLLAGLACNVEVLINAKDMVQDPRYIAMAFIPFYMIMSGRIISDEWRRDTVCWWLTLPYSRAVLLGAKITASFINYVKWTLAAVVASSVLFIEVFVFRPDIFEVAIATLSIRIVQLLVLLLVFSPFTVMAGIFFRLVFYSGLRSGAPLFWFLLPTAFFYAISLFAKGNNDSAYLDKICMIFNSGPRLLLLLLLEIIICAALGFFSVYILDKQVKV